MTGYVRNDTTNNISNGNLIDASDLDGEFDAIQAAYDATTGHKHDGSVGGGAPIEAIGPTQDVVATSSTLRPKTDNTVDLGNSALEYKDLYLDGTAYIDTLQVDESATITANLNVNGNTTLGNAATDTVTFVADVASNLVPSADNTYDLGTTTDEWRNIYIDGTAQVDTLQVDESATITANLTVNGNTTLGNASTDTLTLTAQVASSVVPSVDDTSDLGSTTNEWRNLYIDGTAKIDTLVVDEAASVATNFSVGGSLTVGGSTTLGDTSGDNIVLNGRFASSLIPVTDGASDLGSSTQEWRDLYIDGTANIDSLVADTVNIAAGSATLNTSKVISATGGVATLQRDDTAITTGETLGSLDFQAPNVAGGGDATVVSASVKAVAKATFDTNTNTTSLLLQTANSGAVETRMEIDGNGNVAVDTSTLYVDATNNRVGVNTATPTVDLDVVGAAAVSGNASVGGELTIADKILHSADTDTAIRFPAADTVSVETGGAERMRITSAGAVGIGTNNPGHRLDVASTAPSIRVLDTDGILQGSMSATMRFGAGGSSNADHGVIGFPTTSVGSMYVTNHEGNLIFNADSRNLHTNSLMLFNVDGGEKLRIDSSGNVGVGTTAPSQKLHVAGSAYVLEDLIIKATPDTASATVIGGVFNTGTDGTNLLLQGLGTIGDTSPIFQYYKGTNQTVRIEAGGNATFNSVTAGGDVTVADKIIHNGDTDTAIRFPAADTFTVETAGSERVRVDSTGNVGIGVTPTEKLDVSGNIKASGNLSAANLLSGTYTPTVTAVANVASSAVTAAAYTRVGNMVTVFGRITITATAANTDTQFRLSLPIATDITINQAVAGTGASIQAGTYGSGIGITGDSTNDEADFRLRPANTSANAYSYSFSYRV